MPIYEYKCKKCNGEFELLVFSNTEVKCPECQAKDVEKKMSVFGMSGVEKPFAGTESGCTSCKKVSCSSCG